MCPQGIGAVDRPMHMDENIVKKLVPFMKNSHSIQLHGIGEPFLSEGFWEILKYLPPAADWQTWKQGKCVSSVNTNLTTLRKEHLEKILQSNLSIINVSLDTPNKETYEKIRGYDFEKVIGNLRKLVKARGDRRFPRIWANMTLMKENVTQIIDFMKLTIEDIGCDRVLTWIMNNMSLEEKQKYNKNIDGWNFNYDEQGQWNNQKLFKEEITKAMEYSKRKNLDFDYANKV
jgi:MoaA/NifB/PqqE/SkfB family radical SAM enzyme